MYTLLELEPPAALLRPIADPHRQHPATSQPTSLLDVKIDGRVTYFEWLNAGHFSPRSARGTMTMAEPNRIEQVHFGFDERRLLHSLGCAGRHVAHDWPTSMRVRIVFAEPEGFELLVRRPASAQPHAQLFHNDVPVSAAGRRGGLRRGAGDCRFRGASLGVGHATRRFGTAPSWFEESKSIERIPAEGTIETFVPSPDFELIMWQA